MRDLCTWSEFPTFICSQTKGQFTLWTTKSDQGVVRAQIGSWALPGTTLVYTKDKMTKRSWRLRSPKYNFQGLINAPTWSNKFCGERGKRGGMVGKGRGPWQKKCYNNFFGGFYIHRSSYQVRFTRHTFWHLYDVINLEKQGPLGTCTLDVVLLGVTK